MRGGREWRGPYNGHQAPVNLPEYALVRSIVDDDALMRRGLFLQGNVRLALILAFLGAPEVHGRRWGGSRYRAVIGAGSRRSDTEGRGREGMLPEGSTEGTMPTFRGEDSCASLACANLAYRVVSPRCPPLLPHSSRF